MLIPFHGFVKHSPFSSVNPPATNFTDFDAELPFFFLKDLNLLSIGSWLITFSNYAGYSDFHPVSSVPFVSLPCKIITCVVVSYDNIFLRHFGSCSGRLFPPQHMENTPRSPRIMVTKKTMKKKKKSGLKFYVEQ